MYREGTTGFRKWEGWKETFTGQWLDKVAEK